MTVADIAEPDPPQDHASGGWRARVGRAPVSQAPMLSATARRLVVAFGAALVLLLVSHPISDPDTWQHLRVGQVIWQEHGLPRTNVWTWPTLGAPYDILSWLFRAMLWPVWNAFGVPGLFVWRWVTALGLFALLYLAARRATRGQSDGLITVALILWSALFWRQRWQCRPETLVAPLLAAELFLLETARRRKETVSLFRDPLWLLVPLQILWINVHVSYYLGLVVVGGFVLDRFWRSRRGDRSAAPGRLMLVAAVAAAACMINPYGWRGVWQPFAFMFQVKQELIYQVVDELQPLDWTRNVWNALPLYLVLMVGLAVWRWRRVGFDAAQALPLAVLLPQALATNRFLGLFAVATLPFFARDLTEALDDAKWWHAMKPQWARASLALVPVVALGAIEIARAMPAFGAAVNWARWPVRACDFMADRDVRGRGYNMFWHGGYLLWRFWPQRDRLPFMDVHQTGSRADRDLHVLSQRTLKAWLLLDQRHRFDWVLLPTRQIASQNLLDYVDADTNRWALVFADDAASLFLRRDGRAADLAQRFAYREMRLGDVRSVPLGRQALADPLLRARLRPELDRAVQGSPWNSRALSLRATVALAERRWTDVRRDLAEALRVNPWLDKGYDRLAYALLMSGEPKLALIEIGQARRRRMSDATTESLARRAHKMIEEQSEGHRGP